MSDVVARILIAEDQDITRLGLKLTLEKLGGIVVVGEAADGNEAITQAMSLTPDIILMDVDLPGKSGIDATIEIKKMLPKTGIIIFTSDDHDDTVLAALSAGADGYCLKNISIDKLATAITSILQGAAWLDPGVANRVLRAQALTRPPTGATPPGGASGSNRLNERHVQVLSMIEQGMTSSEIAEKLGIDAAFLEDQVRSILGSFLQQQQPKIAQSGPTGTARVDLSALHGGDDKALVPGSKIGDRYEIESVIGEGGMGLVYSARHSMVGKKVAVKMLHQNLTSDGLAVQRFHQEARAASALDHPNLVNIFDFGVTPSGSPYLVMDFIDGVSLSDLIDGTALEVSRAVKIFMQVCDALAVAHDKGVVHRDLKPSNIMLVKTLDGSDFVKLLDFGIAKCLDEKLDPRLTRTGELFGTPLYMSPEQCRGLPLDARADIYALGCVLYEALSGEPAFLAETVLDVLNRQVNETPSRAPFIRPGREIPLRLEQIIYKTLEKEASQRYQSVLELKRDLQGLLAQC